jgi:hypothetical protein
MAVLAAVVVTTVVVTAVVAALVFTGAVAVDKTIQNTWYH